jgi:CheY-like chemotaxis protein
VVGEAANGVEAADLSRRLHPDVILLDLVMPEMDGIRATSEIARHSPGSRVIILTSFGDDDRVFPAIRAGAQGYLLKYTVSYEGDLQIEKVMEATDTHAELPTLTFGPISAQFVSCAEPEGIMDQEQGYFTVLSSVAYYFRLGGMLMMLDAKGSPLLVFGARY